jgi:hypothetical protein
MSSLPLLDFVSGPRSVTGTLRSREYTPGHGGTRYSGGSKFASFAMMIDTGTGDNDGFSTTGFSADQWRRRWDEAHCRDGDHIETRYARFTGFPIELRCYSHDPEKATATAKRALELMIQTEYPAALELLKEALAYNEGSRMAIYLRGICKIQMGNEREGCADVHKAAAMSGYETPLRGYLKEDSVCFQPGSSP